MSCQSLLSSFLPQELVKTRSGYQSCTNVFPAAIQNNNKLAWLIHAQMITAHVLQGMLIDIKVLTDLLLQPICRRGTWTTCDVSDNTVTMLTDSDTLLMAHSTDPTNKTLRHTFQPLPATATTWVNIIRNQLKEHISGQVASTSTSLRAVPLGRHQCP